MLILIADGHTLVREGLRSFLEAHGMEVVGLAATGEEAMSLAQRLHPDLVLMDLAMPGIGGLEATRLISGQVPDSKVVVLAVAIEQDDLLAAVQAGAWGYVHKDVDPVRFLALLEGVVRGEPALPPELAWKLLGALAAHGQEKKIERALHALTAREREVVELLARGVTSNHDLAKRLGVSEHTIKYHLRNVLDKLRLQDRAQVVSYAFRHRLAHRELLSL